MRVRIHNWRLGLRGRTGQRTELSDRDEARLRGDLARFGDEPVGAANARERAERLATTYLGLEDAGRIAYLRLVARELDAPLETAREAARALLDAAEPTEQAAALDRARVAFEAPWRVLLSEMNGLQEGTKFLVDLRADLLRFAREAPELVPLERDLCRLLADFFDVGFLDLHRITWDSPASLLETFAESEAVHTVTDWTDLKNRLEPDRRFFAFFHPRMPAEPLIFVQVALADRLPAEIGPLLDPAAPEGDPASATTAVFYSISAAQPGLAGISFGGFLIKQVVDELARELPRLKTFATLSPIPGFRAWLENAVRASNSPFAGDDREALAHALAAASPHELDEHREPLVRACSFYLTSARRPDGRALDPVAHFHLANGARVERVNWRGDVSDRGFRGSLGLMVNYLYQRGDLAENQHAYAGGRVVASNAVMQAAQRDRR